MQLFQKPFLLFVSICLAVATVAQNVAIAQQDHSKKAGNSTKTVVSQNTSTAATALQDYLKKPDNAYKWEIKDSFPAADGMAYSLLLTSQQWKQYTWNHQLTIIVPKELRYDGALLFINGGSNNKTTQLPNWGKKEDALIQQLGMVAEKNKAIIANLKQVPNQPLFGDLTEDQAISYTLHQFQKDHDYTWPLLFPMVKSAVKAMDAIQEFAAQKTSQKINRFVVSGASKRGWTSWLTGANDPRVAAIGPMVIDILNMPVNLAHQIESYGTYSVEIDDYVKLGIVQSMENPEGREIVTMIDPYSYRQKLTIPKLIFIGANDPYWVIDNVKNYLSDIPGDNLIQYTPNAGHDLNKGYLAFPALSAFFGITVSNGKYPVCKWTTKATKKAVKLKVTTTRDILKGAKLWYALSSDKDFRNEKWTSRELHLPKKSVLKLNENLPESGYKSFYVDLIYADPNGGEYTISTRAFMLDHQKIL